MTNHSQLVTKQTLSNRRTTLPVVQRYNGPNPFLNYETSTLYEKFKILLFTITLLGSLRFIMIIIILSFATTLSMLITYNQPIDKPLNRTYFRQKGIELLRYMGRMILLVAGFYYVPINYDKLSNLKNARCIVCNHFSVWDGVLLVSYMECSPIVKAELLRTPLIGNILRALQCVGVERTSDTGKHQALNNIEIHMKDKQYPPVLIFPQGTTCYHTFMTMWKMGAFTSGLPIQPITIKYENEYGLDLTGDVAVSSIYKTCCQFINYASLDILPMYYPNAEEIKNPILYAKSVREIIANHLGILLTDHSYEDYLLQCQAKNGNIDANHLVTYKIAESLGLHYTLPIKAVKIFCSYDKNKNGYYTYNDFKNLFFENGNDNRFKHMLNTIFSCADTNKNEKLEIDEFISLLACMMCSKNIEHMISLIFECLDFNEAGVIDKNNFKQFINDYKSYDIVKNEVQQVYDILFPTDADVSHISFENCYSKLCNDYQLLRSINSYIFKNIIQVKDWDKFESHFN